MILDVRVWLVLYHRNVIVDSLFILAWHIGGNGPLTLQIANVVGPEGYVYGIDSSENMVSHRQFGDVLFIQPPLARSTKHVTLYPHTPIPTSHSKSPTRKTSFYLPLPL